MRQTPWRRRLLLALKNNALEQYLPGSGGVMHPTEVLDSSGVDEKESACKTRP